MAVKIKDMTVPDNCMACLLASLQSTSGARYCLVTNYNVTNKEYERHDECPMEEVED